MHTSKLKLTYVHVGVNEVTGAAWVGAVVLR